MSSRAAAAVSPTLACTRVTDSWIGFRSPLLRPAARQRTLSHTHARRILVDACTSTRQCGRVSHSAAAAGTQAHRGAHRYRYIPKQTIGPRPGAARRRTSAARHVVSSVDAARRERRMRPRRTEGEIALELRRRAGCRQRTSVLLADVFLEAVGVIPEGHAVDEHPGRVLVRRVQRGGLLDRGAQEGFALGRI